MADIFLSCCLRSAVDIFSKQQRALPFSGLHVRMVVLPLLMRWVSNKKNGYFAFCMALA
jgi:hypothetical protein